ncbi:MAG TPA: amidohydrolase family protein [Caulobacteraceae bacterium]|nr:amidohydrolase family protein [Caulobacteraceae bacterium]
MRVDAHQHFWRLERGDYGWLTPDLQPIHRDFGPDDLRPLTAAVGVEKTVLVQAAPTEAETDFLLRLAADEPLVAGVVGWVDFAAPDAAHRIAALAARPKLIGLRPMIQDLPDDRWMLSDAIAPALAAMADEGLTFDALVLPRHLPILREFAARHPALDIVIDHGAKPEIAKDALDGWARDMRAIAAETRLVCKLSGLVTEAAPGWTAETLRPYVEVLLEAFGADRLMWGSDWPVVNLNGSYAGWWGAAEALLVDLSGDERDAILGGTASVFYGLDRP